MYLLVESKSIFLKLYAAFLRVTLSGSMLFCTYNIDMLVPLLTLMKLLYMLLNAISALNMCVADFEVHCIVWVYLTIYLICKSACIS